MNRPRLIDPGPAFWLPGIGLKQNVPPRVSISLLCNYYGISKYLACNLILIEQAFLYSRAPKYMTNKFLAKWLDRSVSQIQRILSKLEDAKLIQRQFIHYNEPHRRRKTGKWVPRYTCRIMSTVLEKFRPLRPQPRRSPGFWDWHHAVERLSKQVGKTLSAHLMLGVGVTVNPDGDGLDWVYRKDPYTGQQVRWFSMGPETQRFQGFISYGDYTERVI